MSREDRGKEEMSRNVRSKKGMDMTDEKFLKKDNFS
jgi:hypothetical protein